MLHAIYVVGVMVIAPLLCVSFEYIRKRKTATPNLFASGLCFGLSVCAV